MWGTTTKAPPDQQLPNHLGRPSSGVLPDGNNAQVCYLNMEWAHGDFDGGSNGCCGNTPGITGADNDLVNPDPSSGNHVQFGRFNLLNDTYNGPYGDDDNEQDGVYWLNGKKFNINTTSNESNLKPCRHGELGLRHPAVVFGPNP